MTFEDVKLLIDEFPKYIQYIYPGYITIYLYYYFRGLTIKDSKNILVKSVSLSFIYVVFLNEVLKVEYASFEYNILLVIVGATVAYIAYRLIESASFQERLNGIEISTSTHWNEIDAVRDYNDGGSAWFKIFLNDRNIAYEGSLLKHESEPEKKCFIVLSGYRKLYVESDGVEKVLLDFKHDNTEKVILYSDDIKYIEVASIRRIRGKVTKTTNTNEGDV